eukprot:365136_1
MKLSTAIINLLILVFVSAGSCMRSLSEQSVAPVIPPTSKQVQQTDDAKERDPVDQVQSNGFVGNTQQITAQWSFKNPKEWITIPSESNAQIEAAFRKGESSVEVTKGFYGKRPSRFWVDFNEMKMHSSSGNFDYDIKRVDPEESSPWVYAMIFGMFIAIALIAIYSFKK